MFGRKKPHDEQPKPSTQPGRPGHASQSDQQGQSGQAGQGLPSVRPGAAESSASPGSGAGGGGGGATAAPRPPARASSAGSPGTGAGSAAGATGGPRSAGAQSAAEPPPAAPAASTPPAAQDASAARPASAARSGHTPSGSNAASAPMVTEPAPDGSGAASGAGGSGVGVPPASGLGPGAVPPWERTLAPGESVDLTAVLGPLTIPNPVMTASGCAANGAELHRFFDVSTLGAFVTKTVLADPRAGRGTPRMAETASGMLNSIGLQGPGIDAFVEKDLAWLMSAGARVIVSIGGNDPREFATVANRLVESPAFDACVGVEVNISCPNVANRGLVFACDPAATTEVVDRVRTQVPPGIPILVKLSPDVTDIVAIARAAVHAGADGLTMINTLLGLEIDTLTMRPALAGITGGLSGPAVRPVALRAVWQVYAAMQAGDVPARPIVGVGGVRTGRDALGFLAAGATAVQVGTAIFNDPHAPVRVRDELADELRARGLASPADAVGLAHRRIPEPAS